VKGPERRRGNPLAPRTTMSEQAATKDNIMFKQIEICGQRFVLYRPDNGRTWSSSPLSIMAYGQRQKRARLELQKGFELIDEIQDPDPNNFSDLPRSLIRV
jgi:hypothetical protein